MLKSKLKSLKTLNKMTVKQISERTGESESTIYRLLNGRLSDPTWHTMKALSECFSVPTDYFNESSQDRMLKLDEVILINYYRTLDTKYKEIAVEYMRNLSEEWIEQVMSNSILGIHDQLRKLTEQLSIIEIIELIDFLKKKQVSTLKEK